MKIAFFDSHKFEQQIFNEINQIYQYQITYFETRLTESTAFLARGHEVVCAFVNDKLNPPTLEILAQEGVKLIALRSAGFNHIHLPTAERLGLVVVRVPEYSPHAVAEHAITLILALNRKVHRAYNRVKDGNFSLEGLVGFDLYQKKVGIIGTGKIGAVLAKILHGFGCQVLAYDLNPNQALEQMGVVYTDLDNLMQSCDIISLHVPLNQQTHHLLNESRLSLTKKGVMIINTSRGGLIDTKALIKFLKSGHLGSAGLDVYEEEEGVFFEDFSQQILQDDQLVRLLTFPNVLLTSHQAFLTHEALKNIADTTLQNIDDFNHHRPLKNQVSSR